MLHKCWLPFFTAFGDDLIIYLDLGVDDPGLSVISLERQVKEEKVLERITVDVLSEPTHFLIEINSGFDSANLFIDKGDWEYRSGIAE